MGRLLRLNLVATAAKCTKYEKVDLVKSVKLKLCPFCGGLAKIFTAFGTHIECTKCGAKIYDFAEEKASRKWNRRMIEDVANTRKKLIRLLSGHSIDSQTDVEYVVDMLLNAGVFVEDREVNKQKCSGGDM